MTVRHLMRGLSALLATLLLSAAAHAQLFRAYLASDGSDANACTLPQPCRLLPAALAAVADGGEIWMLDSANYNAAPVNVGKSVTILAVPGAVGSLVGNGGPAIEITAPSLVVSLRNLVLRPLIGVPIGTGVTMTGNSRLNVDGCNFSNFSSAFVISVSAGTTTIDRSTFHTSVHSVVRAFDGTKVTISRSSFSGITTGAAVLASSNSAATTTVTISDSIINSSQNGVLALTTHASGITRVQITRSTIENTTTAITVNGGPGLASVVIGGSMITNNVAGWIIQAGGELRSLGNNQITDNGASTGSLTSEPPL